MPTRNTVKIYAGEQYYHVYNRGVAKQVIFHDDEDYKVFLNLLKRYLDKEVQKDPRGREYESLRGKVELLAYCLMPNHFHLLLYLVDEKAITVLLRGICTAYTVYYNKKYQRVGSLFQGIFKASRVTSDSYLLHISRYIHMNPKHYASWNYSSYAGYVGKNSANWLQPERIINLFDNNTEEYTKFMQDYEDYKKALEEIKYELADR